MLRLPSIGDAYHHSAPFAEGAKETAAPVETAELILIENVVEVQREPIMLPGVVDGGVPHDIAGDAKGVGFIAVGIPGIPRSAADPEPLQAPAGERVFHP